MQGGLNTEHKWMSLSGFNILQLKPHLFEGQDENILGRVLAHGFDAQIEGAGNRRVSVFSGESN